VPASTIGGASGALKCAKATAYPGFTASLMTVGTTYQRAGLLGAEVGRRGFFADGVGCVGERARTIFMAFAPDSPIKVLACESGSAATHGGA
jgi:hypothetical protein